MSSYCLKCKKNTKHINPRVFKTSIGKTILLWKCGICGSEKPRFFNKEEAKGKLSKLVLKISLSKILLLFVIFRFECNLIE